jgi:hypothetical protein
MMRIHLLVAAALVIPARGAGGQSPAVRQLPPAQAESRPGVVASIAALRATASGHVFVNDIVRRQVVMLDSSLRVVRVVTDGEGARAHYGNGATGLFAFAGDSTLFLSGATLSIAVLDADGNVARIMAPPRPSDFGQLIGGTAGNPAFDARQRLIYRGAGPGMAERIRLGQAGAAPPPDSTVLVRFDFSTRALDTLTYIRTYTPRIVPHVVQKGTTVATWLSPILNPMPMVDDWAVLADGRVAVLRGVDYHVDFFDANKARTSSPKVPFPWRHLSAADKAALLDSSRALRTRLAAQGIGVSHGMSPAPGMEPVASTTTSVSRSVGGAQASSVDPDEPTAEYVAPDELPDYQPAFAVGSLRADEDGRLWVRTIPPAPLSGGAIYDVLDGRGRWIDRVQVPRNSAIAGFGPEGTVYLAQRIGEKLSIRRCHYRPPHHQD